MHLVWSTHRKNLFCLQSHLWSPLLIDQPMHYYYKQRRVRNWLLNTIQTHTCNIYILKYQVLYYKDITFIPLVEELRHDIIHEYHSTPTVCHSGLQPTLVHLSTSFLWPRIHKDVKTFSKTLRSSNSTIYAKEKARVIVTIINTSTCTRGVITGIHNILTFHLLGI